MQYQQTGRERLDSAMSMKGQGSRSTEGAGQSKRLREQIILGEMGVRKHPVEKDLFIAQVEVKSIAGSPPPRGDNLIYLELSWGTMTGWWVVGRGSKLDFER